MADVRAGQTYKVYKTDEDKLRVYNHRMRRAEEKFDQLKPKVNEMFERYRLTPRRGEFTPQGHRITVPDGIGTIDALFAALTAVDVQVLVKNMAHGTRDQAKIAQKGINEVWRETKVARKARRSIKDALIGGVGWLKVDYEYAEEQRRVPRTDQEIETDVSRVFDAAEDAGMEPPKPDQVSELVPTTKVIEEVVRDRVVVDYVPWDKVRWDTTAQNVEDIRWVAQITLVPEHEVKGNAVFREYVKRHRGGLRELEDLEPDAVIAEKDTGIRTRKRSVEAHDDERITIIEMWDFETGTACTFAKNNEKLILNERPNPLMMNEDLEDKSPFVPLILRDDPKSLVGLSDMAVIAPSLDELEEYRSNLATYIGRFVPKIIGPARALTPAGKNALQSREWGAYVELEENATAQDLQPLVPPSLPQEVYDIEPRVAQSIREVTGANELMRGIFPEGTRRSAAEVTEVVAASTARQSEKRNWMEQFFGDVARRILMLMQMFYDAPRVSRLTGQKADEIWTWTAEDIVMEADLEIFLTPKEAVTAQTKRDNALAALNVLGTLPGINMDALLRWVAEEMGIPEDVIRDIIQTPEEQQQAELAAEQATASQAQAEQGQQPDPAAVAGPMDPEALAAAANQGGIPPEMVERLGASPGVGP